MEMQVVIMHLGFLAHWEKNTMLNLKVICIAYRTAQIYFSVCQALSNAMGSAQLK